MAPSGPKVYEPRVTNAVNPKTSPQNPALTFESLNDPQAEAVAHVKGPLLVFAGAGRRGVSALKVNGRSTIAGFSPFSSAMLRL